MQKKRMRGESAKQVAIDVLRTARKPLHTKEIAKRVIESGRCSGLKGKTPEATIAASSLSARSREVRSSGSTRAPTGSQAPSQGRLRPSGPLPSGRHPRRRNRRSERQKLPRRRATSPERAAPKNTHVTGSTTAPRARMVGELSRPGVASLRGPRSASWPPSRTPGSG
jgi:HB1, ASXL, restriction endonuclease HTH domain